MTPEPIRPDPDDLLKHIQAATMQQAQHSPQLRRCREEDVHHARSHAPKKKRTVAGPVPAR